MKSSRNKVKKKILAIGAHYDDVELGCGGSLLMWKDQGHDITIFTASLSGYRDPEGNVIRSDETARAEGVKAANYLEAKLITGDFPTFELEFAEPLNCKLMDVLHNVKPDIVLTHWGRDVHHDHRAVALASLHCCRHIPRLLTYYSNYYESDWPFDPRFFVDISDMFEKKIELIKIYRSEKSRTGELWIDYVRSQSRLMGLKVGVQYAEGFEAVKWLES